MASQSKFIAEYSQFAPDVFEGIEDLAGFMNKMKKFKRKPYYAEFVGFCWEYVVAEYFKKFGEHSTVDVCEYRQTYAGTTKGDDVDFGVDGWGWDMYGDGRIACQVKFRSSKSEKIADELEGVSTMTTFINEIIRDLREHGRPRANTIVLLVTTTTEIYGANSLEEMEKSNFWHQVKQEISNRGVDPADLEIRVYGFNYWDVQLGNPAFWNWLRARYQVALAHC